MQKECEFIKDSRIWRVLLRVTLVLYPFAVYFGFSEGKIVFEQAQILLTYPLLVNFIFLAIFSASLARPPSLVERIARSTQPVFPPQAALYCRRVTAIWCVFFVFNIAVCSWLLLKNLLWWWTVYNGCISYVLMGIIFAGEYLYRRIALLPRLSSGTAP